MKAKIHWSQDQLQEQSHIIQSALSFKLGPEELTAVTLASLGLASTKEELVDQLRRLEPNCSHYDSLAHRLYELQLEKVKSSLSPDKYTIALWMHRQCDLGNEMQVPWVTALEQDPRYNFVVLFSIWPKAIERFDHEPAFFRNPFLFIPDDGLLEHLNFIDVLIALDYAASVPIKLPKNTRRLNQPHGLDIIYQYSMEFYGGGLLFDYILSPSFAPHMLPADPESQYFDVFSPEMIDHDSESVCVFPMGSPKLDTFIKHAEASSPRDIIYNVSAWKLENKFIHDNLDAIIGGILEKFPANRLVFRPFPREVDLHSELISKYQNHPQFFLSTGYSYIEDYKNGAVLLHHRGSSAELFALATCSPIIKLAGDLSVEPGLIQENEIGFVVNHLEDLFSLLERILSDREYKRCEISEYRDKIMPFAGRSMQVLLDNIPAIVNGDPVDGARYFKLYSKDSGRNWRESILYSAEIMDQRRQLIPMLSHKHAVTLENNSLLHFYAARAIFEHIFPHIDDQTPWLIALEHVCQYFENRGASSISGERQQVIDQWLAEVLPERVLGLLDFAEKHFDEGRKEEFWGKVKRLPFDTWQLGGVPAHIRKTIAKRPVTEFVADKLQRALELVEHQQWQQAHDYLKELLSMQPEMVDGHQLLGLCRMQLGLFTEAIESFLEFLKYNSQNLQVWELLANCLAVSDKVVLEEDTVQRLCTVLPYLPLDDNLIKTVSEFAFKLPSPQMQTILRGKNNTNLSNKKPLFVVSNLKKMWKPGADSLSVGDPFLQHIFERDGVVEEFSSVEYAPFLRSDPSELLAYGLEVESRYERYVTILTDRLNAIHGISLPRDFWARSFSTGLHVQITAQYEFFQLMKASFNPDRVDCNVLSPESFKLPFDYNELTWFLLHQSFGQEQLLSMFAELQFPGTLSQVEAQYDQPYKYFYQKGTTGHQPKVGILGTVIKQEYLEGLVGESSGAINSVGYDRLMPPPFVQNPRWDQREILSGLAPDFDEFDRFFFFSLRWLMPSFFVEYFAEIFVSLSEQINQFKRMEWVVSEIWLGDTYESMALAVMGLRGIKHIYNEHNWVEYPFEGNILQRIASFPDVYLKHGSYSANVPNEVQGGTLFDLGVKRDVAPHSGKILYVSGEAQARFFHYTNAYGDLAERSKSYYKFKREFFKALPSEIKNKITYRKYPRDDYNSLAHMSYDDEYMMRDLLENVSLDDWSVSSKERMLNSDLVIIDYISTSHLEALNMNIPTIFFLREEMMRLLPAYQDFFAKLKRVGIAQVDPKNAADFVTRVLNDVESWWNSPSLQEVREEFLELNVGKVEWTYDYLLGLVR